VTPHIARNDAVTKTGKRRRSAVDARTTRHEGYAVSQRVRKRIEEAFGWAKTVAGLAKTKLRGTARNAYRFTFTMAAYNLIRLPRLLAAA
jgi:IS4 transposase